MERTEKPKQNQTAVWYFIGAVFIFTAPNLLFDGLDGWGRALFFAVGIVVMVAGFVQMRREVLANRRAAPPQVPPQGPSRSRPDR
ncbi:hypothetical protein [Brevibacterium spongiae]|uniref:Uncharacterized protein n=1 Tax=Brevibacterium spongiae TaxID=2909672 RepID=A0ABY5SQN3_9MICO|nr:hypothetical protein [Brevibacterium spongiae]UVI36852.1 hypothetical protein L1F31_04125 [Brevibacterium spongiae]